MAVRTAADMGATVINVSSVACLPAQDALDDRALGAALAYAVDVKNVVVVAAAGNVGACGPVPRPESRGGSRAARPARTGSDVNVVVSPAWYDEYRPDGRLGRPRRRAVDSSAWRGRGSTSPHRERTSCRWIPTAKG